MRDIDDPTVDACTSHSCARSVLTCFLVSPLFVPFPCCCFSLLLSVHTYVPCHYVFFVVEVTLVRCHVRAAGWEHSGGHTESR